MRCVLIVQVLTGSHLDDFSSEYRALLANHRVTEYTAGSCNGNKKQQNSDKCSKLVVNHYNMLQIAANAV